MAPSEVDEGLTTRMGTEVPGKSPGQQEKVRDRVRVVGVKIRSGLQDVGEVGRARHWVHRILPFGAQVSVEGVSRPLESSTDGGDTKNPVYSFRPSFLVSSLSLLSTVTVVETGGLRILTVVVGSVPHFPHA